MPSKIYCPPPQVGGGHQFRSDIDTAYTVDQSLGVQACHGTFYAALLLRNKGLDIALALRVLAHPSERRQAPGRVLYPPPSYCPQADSTPQASLDTMTDAGTHAGAGSGDQAGTHAGSHTGHHLFTT
jgi:hypothetical protein